MGTSTVITPIDARPEDLDSLRRALGAAAGPAMSAEVAIAGGVPTAPLPAPLLDALREIVIALASGKSVTLIAEDAELTTQEAADLLMVSRPHLVKLLDEGVIAFHKVGTHRRVKVADVMAYRKGRDAQRLDRLGELSRLSHEIEGEYR